MGITKRQKEQQVLDIKEMINNNHAVIAWNYSGLNSHQTAEIKKIILKADSKDVVYKNRIAKIAFSELGFDINSSLIDSTSFLFIKDENSTALKDLHDFLKKADDKKEEKIERFKIGIINKEVYDSKSILEIATLPSKDELLSMLISVLQGNIRNFAYVLSQVASKKEE